MSTLEQAGPGARDDPVKILANATNRSILNLLAQGPSYPRAIAQAIGVSEGDAQRKLHRLERAGLVHGAWHHEGKTVKEYRLVASGIVLDFQEREMRVRLLPIR